MMEALRQYFKLCNISLLDQNEKLFTEKYYFIVISINTKIVAKNYHWASIKLTICEIKDKTRLINDLVLNHLCVIKAKP